MIDALAVFGGSTILWVEIKIQRRVPARSPIAFSFAAVT